MSNINSIVCANYSSLWQERTSQVSTDVANGEVICAQIAVAEAAVSNRLALYPIAEDHGLHSLRKAASSYGSGFPGGSNLVSIFLRANWSISQVKDK
jgi:hypothetical protein